MKDEVYSHEAQQVAKVHVSWDLVALEVGF